MGIGDFNSICAQAPVPPCSVLGPGGMGIEPTCYARNIELANTIIFEPAASVVHIVTLVMTVIMILHVRSKFVAIGRKEMTDFFYLFVALTFTTLVLDSGVVPPASSVFPWFAAIQSGFASALCVCLLINGIVSFQSWDDGTILSVWGLRTASFIMFLITGLVALCTFKGWAGLGPTNTAGLFVISYIVSSCFLLVYVVMQVILVTTRVDVGLWPLGHLAFGLAFLITGQIVLYVFNDTICDSAQHYIDGLFITSVCNLFAIMMVYKYWDSVTHMHYENAYRPPLQANFWEVKELLPEDERRATTYQDAEYSSTYPETRARESRPLSYDNY